MNTTNFSWKHKTNTINRPKHVERSEAYDRQTYFSLVHVPALLVPLLRTERLVLIGLCLPVLASILRPWALRSTVLPSGCLACDNIAARLCRAVVRGLVDRPFCHQVVLHAPTLPHGCVEPSLGAEPRVEEQPTTSHIFARQWMDGLIVDSSRIVRHVTRQGAWGRGWLPWRSVKYDCRLQIKWRILRVRIVALDGRLVKNYQPKKKDEEDYQYSPCKAFKSVMTEINDLAGQHEVIAENLTANVIREVTILAKEFKDDRKKHLHDGARMMGNLSTQIMSMERAKKNYEKAFREAEKALENYQRADADLNLSRAEVEKQKYNMTVKSQQCEEAKTEYANQLQRANDLQNQHFHTMMPQVFHELQELDEKRIKNIKNFMMKSVDIERNVFPIITVCLDGIDRAAGEINEKEDTNLVIERYKSGFQPPEDFPFEDLSAIKNGEAPPPNNNVAVTTLRPEAMTMKGTVTGGKLKKRVGIFGIFGSNKNNFSSYENKEDFSDLPPNQRKKKLHQRIEEIQGKLQQETAARDGLMKMKGVYEQNPALGDPMSIEGQLNESGHKLDKLRQELHKYQAFLEETAEIRPSSGQSVSPAAPGRRNKGAAPGHHLNGGNLHRSHRNSGGSGGEEGSLSRSASDSSVSNPAANHKQSAPGTPIPSHGSSNSPESGLGTSHTSLPDSDPEQDTGTLDVLPSLGICRALYPFEATSEGSIPMYDGEELGIIEVDQGDGWTRVRRQTDLEEGFVPTSYIEVTLYN